MSLDVTETEHLIRLQAIADGAPDGRPRTRQAIAWVLRELKKAIAERDREQDAALVLAQENEMLREGITTQATRATEAEINLGAAHGQVRELTAERDRFRAALEEIEEMRSEEAETQAAITASYALQGGG